MSALLTALFLGLVVAIAVDIWRVWRRSLRSIREGSELASRIEYERDHRHEVGRR